MTAFFGTHRRRGTTITREASGPLLKLLAKAAIAALVCAVAAGSQVVDAGPQDHRGGPMAPDFIDSTGDFFQPIAGDSAIQGVRAEQFR